jgi:deoxycytidylate deaminase
MPVSHNGIASVSNTEPFGRPRSIRGTGVKMQIITDISNYKKFMDEAFSEAEKSRCFKQQVGAVIVKDGKILTRGFNHPIGEFCKECIREKLNLHAGSNAEICYAVHAEQEVIIEALNNHIDINGATMYTAAIKKGEKRIHKGPYCSFCSRIIAKTKLKNVIHYAGDKFISYNPLEENKLAIENSIKNFKRNHLTS